MIRRPPRSTRTDTLFPYTTLFRSIVRNLCARDARIRLIINTRNFGQLRSPAHALFQARGRGIIGIAADFQDPPELIPELVQRWRAGTDIVLGVSETKKSYPLSRSEARRVGKECVSTCKLWW